MLPLLLLPPAAHGALGNVSKPHILFALVDDLGWNDVGWHDSFGQIQTPKLNKLRLDSVELSQYYVYRYCSPSRSTILTGRFPWHLGQQTEMNLNPTPGIACGISPAYSFLPSVLQRAGYATWALGKWRASAGLDPSTSESLPLPCVLAPSSLTQRSMDRDAPPQISDF
jgi:arylsulfatase A-like enzyme